VAEVTTRQNNDTPAHIVKHHSVARSAKIGDLATVISKALPEVKNPKRFPEALPRSRMMFKTAAQNTKAAVI